MLLIVTNLSWSQNLIKIVKEKNNALWFVLAGTIIALGLVLYAPFLRRIFHLSFLPMDDLLIALACGIISLLWFEGLKALNRKNK